jgi:hypothetical protein
MFQLPDLPKEDANGDPGIWVMRLQSTSGDSVVTNNYSLSERVTLQTWFDGRPVYWKTYNNVNLPAQGATALTPSTIFDFQKFIKSEASGYNPASGRYEQLDPDDIDLDAADLIISGSKDYSGWTDVTVTVYYLKSL